MSTSPTVKAPPCRRCLRNLRHGEGIHLWDGHDYCRECVSSASPALLALAEEVPVLSERIAVDPREAVWANLRLMGIISVIFLCAFCYILRNDAAGLWFHMLVAAVLIIPPTLMTTYRSYRTARAASGTVQVEEGDVRVKHPYLGRVAWALCECRWHVGKAEEAHAFFPKLALSRKVVILECPIKVPFLWTMRERVPCGLSDETREIWIAFLTLAGIEQKPRWWQARRNKSLLRPIPIPVTGPHSTGG